MATRQCFSVDDVLNLLDEDSGQSGESDDEFDDYMDEEELDE